MTFHYKTEKSVLLKMFEANLPFENQTGIQMVDHLNTGQVKRQVFKCFRYSIVRFSDPHCC